MEYPRIIHLKKIPDARGNLTAIEQNSDVPFAIRRVYWIFDVPGGERRGGHAYRKAEELIIALSGSFDVIVDNGRERDSFSLNRSYFGLYVPAGKWRELSNFSTNSIALILSSTDYDEDDYIRDYDEFESYADEN
ncbi:MAG: FdtA/QdtA family cupin domain-containing protein [Muribaculaceae bacterium]|nr:FdtA/QdtA family cupin domain-containing protein [Muribaculaceae bacterium]MDE6130240.1 FdtA/QdtA family cupin domain-containing protein [Muribaculaceae bacterium]